jgi:hypothetical protein
MLAIEVVNARRDFTRGPFTDRLLEQTLVVGQIEINQRQLPASSFQLPASSFQLPAPSFQLSFETANEFRSALTHVTRSKLSAITGNWQLAAGS